MVSPRASRAALYAPLSIPTSDSGDPPVPTLCFMLGINAFAFAYSLVVSTLGLVILPSEAAHLFLDRHAIMLGVMLGCSGITQLIAPAVGYISDRSTSRYGRRRPAMVAGALLACVGSIAMRLARDRDLGFHFIFALTAAIFGVNVSYACYTALLPDFIPTVHMGRASGVMAAMSMLGSFVGFAIVGFCLDVVHAYSLYVVTIILTILVTCLTAREQEHKTVAATQCNELMLSYTIDATAHPDFFWVFVTRTFYYMGISIQAFVLFMLRDVQRVDDPKYYTSILAMIGQLAAGIIAVPAGQLSDRTGRKPVVYASCVIMALVYFGFALEPSITVLLILGVGYGLGNGMFLSVDYALACDVLPSLEHAAQSLGVWGVSAFLGSTLGPLVAGPLLTHFGWTPSPERYSSTGYLVVMMIGAVYVTCAAFLLRYVQAR